MEKSYKDQLIIENESGCYYYLFNADGDIEEYRASDFEDAKAKIDARIKAVGLYNADGELTKESILSKLVELRSRAFDMANSGKYGNYPLDESFNEEVEKGFNADGTSWTSKSGVTITI